MFFDQFGLPWISPNGHGIAGDAETVAVPALKASAEVSDMLCPVILSGGSGTRLWPLSRDYFPKQFLPLVAKRTMLQETLSRLDGLREVARPLIVCNEANRFLVADQMREIQRDPLQIIIEPVGRNTAPALTLAALDLTGMGRSDTADPVMVVMPADHAIRDVDALRASLEEGALLADAGHIVAFGVIPSGPATGYGYIQAEERLDPAVKTADSSARRISAFVEKPDRETAKTYVDSGDWLWNSGMFLVRASVWLSEIDRQRPAIARACRAAHQNGHKDGDFYRPGAADFIACPSDSIDYAVMESAVSGPENPATAAAGAEGTSAPRAVVRLDAGWTDVGAWSALWEVRDQDPQGNVVQGDVYTHSTRNSLLLANDRLLAAIGIEDLVVVETADAVLVARRDRVEDVREIVGRLRDDGRPEQASHLKVHRPWGSYEIMDSGPGFQVKRLTINAGSAISLQKHHRRAEHWVVVVGTARVTRGEDVFLLKANQSTYVPVGMTHRLENPGGSPLEIIEVETGSYLGEDDIVRFQDNYNRHNDTGA